MSNCYLCGTAPSPNKLSLKNTFTAHCFAKFPDSDCLCDRCQFSINTRANYWNEAKGKYSLLYARNWSWLYQGSKLISPVFDGEHEHFPIVKKIMTRVEMRQHLIDPPNPPFTLAIAESGQKHILFLAQEAQSRELFPVQFELNTVIVRRADLINALQMFEKLLAMGASKTDILSGEYKSQFLMSAIIDPTFDVIEQAISALRGSRYLDLISHVAQRPETEVTKQPVKTEPTMQPSKPLDPAQLSLF